MYSGVDSKFRKPVYGRRQVLLRATQIVITDVGEKLEGVL